MSYRKIAGYTLTVALLAATCMVAISVLSEQLQPIRTPPRVLFIADALAGFAVAPWKGVERPARASSA